MAISKRDQVSPPAMAVMAAASVTVLDGFDAFSLSLMARGIGAELNLEPTALGTIFAAAMGGMIIGALTGGAAADRFGRLPALIAAITLFSVASFAMVLVNGAAAIMINRAIAGIGLGAAAPIAIGLLSRSAPEAPSKFLLSAVWAGIAAGGILAAAFSYFFSPSYGWRAIFVAGAILPLLAATLAYFAFRTQARTAGGNVRTPAKLTDLFAAKAAPGTIVTALMFFFGYVTTSIIANWLPTILGNRDASPLMIALTFAGVNLGGLISAFAIGLLADATRSRWVLVLAWASVGACGVAAGLAALDISALAALAIASSSLGVAAQSLSVALANLLHRERGLEATSVGFMTASGRAGQFAVLSLVSVLLGAGMPESGLFVIAGVSAAIAAVLAFAVVRLPALQAQFNRIENGRT